MRSGAPLLFRSNANLIAAHASLLAGMVGLLFLQRYIWVEQIAERGYGPYQSVSYLAEASAVIVVIDLLIFRSLWHGSRWDRAFSLAWPAFWFGLAVLILILNNA
ncbi:MAG: hypothetical protein ABSA72_02145 [Nitrososphaerales archaeon]|jgi:hypothetical protein